MVADAPVVDCKVAASRIINGHGWRQSVPGRMFVTSITSWDTVLPAYFVQSSPGCGVSGVGSPNMMLTGELLVGLVRQRPSQLTSGTIRAGCHFNRHLSGV